MEDWVLFFLIVLGSLSLIASVDKDKASSHNRRDIKNKEEAQRSLERLRRTARDWYGYTQLHPANHDGNPFNDTIGASMLPGTDSWNFRHCR
jgi:hypothetical protein